MAFNGYLSTFVHISHIVSALFLLNWQRYQFCAWHVCLADDCSLLSVALCFSPPLVAPVVSAHQTRGRVSSRVPAFLWWSSPFWQIPGETGRHRHSEAVTGTEWHADCAILTLWTQFHTQTTGTPRSDAAMRFSGLQLVEDVSLWRGFVSVQHVTKTWSCLRDVIFRMAYLWKAERVRKEIGFFVNKLCTHKYNTDY